MTRHPTPDTRHLFPHRGFTYHVGEFLRNSHLWRHPRVGDTRLRAGFTLVELLITITIIGILAGLILGVASVAGETARHRHTEQVIARIHTLLMEHYDTYKSRRVALRQPIIDGINNQNNLSASQRGQLLATARLHALRELIVMEVPDRWSDILLNDVPDPPTGLADSLIPFFQDLTGASTTGRTSLADVYLRRYAAIATRTNSVSGQRNTAEEITDNQGAECLYLFIMTATGDGEARSLFGENMIGDTDGDGAKEFLDGWDRPINFLRWAPGFDSQIQLNANRLNPPPNPTNPQANAVWKSAADSDHDPFDIFRVDPNAFRLVPLIFSGGGDETFGIRLVKPYSVLKGLTRPQAMSASPVSLADMNARAIIPYRLIDDAGVNVFLGSDSGEGAATDNIHNHLLGDR